jgi:uncharacterized surface protein with fasciclin (FAS1) repeats
MKRILLFVAFAVLTLGLTACPAETTTPTPLKTIAEVAAGNPDFSILVEALTKAGLVDTFKGTDKYTVFAPTNAAFSALLTELNVTKEQLLALPNLADILKYHVVSGEVKAASLTDGQEVTTLQGGKVKVAVSADKKVSLNNGRANVTTADVAASNGVIHIIDKVLTLPAAPAVTVKTYALSATGAGGTNVSGTAKFEKISDAQTKVTINLTGTPAGGSHPAHIHVGSNPPGGGIYVTLTNVDGTTGESISTVNETFESLTTYDGYINVHLSAADLATVVATGETGAGATVSLHKH